MTTLGGKYLVTFADNGCNDFYALHNQIILQNFDAQ